MRIKTALLTIMMFVLTFAGPSIAVNAQDGQADIALIEQWLDREAIPHWQVRAWNESVVAETTPAADGLLIDKHTAAGLSCHSCHTASDAGPDDKHPPVRIQSFDAKCVACHGTMIEAPEGKEMSSPNPHVSPHLGPGEAPQCTECHQVHQRGEVTCNLCHRGFNFTID